MKLQREDGSVVFFQRRAARAVGGLVNAHFAVQVADGDGIAVRTVSDGADRSGLALKLADHIHVVVCRGASLVFRNAINTRPAEVAAVSDEVLRRMPSHAE